MHAEREAEGWRDVNVGGRERLVSMFLGGGLVAYALTRRRLAARLLLLPGLMLLARGRGGRSVLYTLFDVSTVPSEPQHRRTVGRRRRAAEPVEPSSAEAGSSGPIGRPPGPRVPGTHQHPVPPEEMGVPPTQVTEKLMSEIAAAGPTEGEAEPEG